MNLESPTLAVIARKMGKSKSWLSQRLNGHEVNGKPARFTKIELSVFVETSKDVCKEFVEDIGEFAANYETPNASVSTAS